ncbi:hypothetical protein GCM10010472_52130 [Pseudonocardia halophobica]|uniref:Uncharacterized protein n=1 Tax=Pseudonocardia halophobica TaxID=29401 RepID=A0A9W6L5C3_9PSEU|nr:hypothetical protein GCM10017577_24900 [Pseudonocardia halophobica]
MNGSKIGHTQTVDPRPLRDPLSGAAVPAQTPAADGRAVLRPEHDVPFTTSYPVPGPWPHD